MDFLSINYVAGKYVLFMHLISFSFRLTTNCTCCNLSLCCLIFLLTLVLSVFMLSLFNYRFVGNKALHYLFIWNVLISPSPSLSPFTFTFTFEGILTGYRILEVIFCKHLKNVPLYSGSHNFCWELNYHFYHGSFEDNVFSLPLADTN